MVSVGIIYFTLAQVDAPTLVPVLAKQKVVGVSAGGLHNTVVTEKV